MNHFDYRNGVLHAEAVSLVELADAVGTPFYCYSTATLERHYRVFSEAFLPVAAEIRADIPNYTDIEPVIQVSKVSELRVHEPAPAG